MNNKKELTKKESTAVSGGVAPALNNEREVLMHSMMKGLAPVVSQPECTDIKINDNPK